MNFALDGSLVQSGQVTQTTARILTNGITVFTIAGGPIRVTDLISICIVGGDGAASTLQWSADGTVGAATTFTGASASLAAFAAGGIVNCNFTALSTAPLITGTNGVQFGAPANGSGIYIPAGIITMVIGTADSTTGTYQHFIRWVPMGSSVTVTAAF